MSGTGTDKRSLVEQILDATLERIADREEFDAGVIQRLRTLTTSRDWAKPAKVTQAIRSMPGEKP